MHFFQVIQQFGADKPDTLAIDVPAGWGQGRAVFGGMAATLAMAHLLPVIPTGMPLRSVSVSFVAPLNAGLWQPDGKLAAISRQTVTVFA